MTVGNLFKYLPDLLITGGIAVITFFVTRSAHRTVFYASPIGGGRQFQRTENIYQGDTPLYISLAVFLIALGVAVALRRYWSHRQR